MIVCCCILCARHTPLNHSKKIENAFKTLWVVCFKDVSKIYDVLTGMAVRFHLWFGLEYLRLQQIFFAFGFNFFSSLFRFSRFQNIFKVYISLDLAVFVYEVDMIMPLLTVFRKVTTRTTFNCLCVEWIYSQLSKKRPLLRKFFVRLWLDWGMWICLLISDVRL